MAKSKYVFLPRASFVARDKEINKRIKGVRGFYSRRDAAREVVSEDDRQYRALSKKAREKFNKEVRDANAKRIAREDRKAELKLYKKQSAKEKKKAVATKKTYTRGTITKNELKARAKSLRSKIKQAKNASQRKSIQIRLNRTTNKLKNAIFKGRTGGGSTSGS